MQMQKIGPHALAWAKEAVKERDVRAYRLLQGVVRLTRSHPRERVEWACATALQGRAFRYQTVKRLAENAAARAQGLQLHHQHAVIRDLTEYQVLVVPTPQPASLHQTRATVRLSDGRNDQPTTSDTWETS